MSLFDPDSMPPAEVTEKQPTTTTSTTIMIFIVISAVGLSAVVGFVLFVAWYRMKKRRQQHEASVELVELSLIEAALQVSPARQRQDIGVAY
jgi:NADH:ubiquinone oxidoreductase subunit K